MRIHPFVHTLLEWYPRHHRDLPWRNTNDPYIIWLSEIILQQTRVAQGLPYFLKFLDHYPDVQSLANAPIEDVMRLWQGLGYYSRARNLHECAKMVVLDYGGTFPNNYKDLLKLKGVGSYTAAAIASFAFGEQVAVVDGNVFRVLSRYFGIFTDIATPAGKKEFETLANQLIPADVPDVFNQSIMEFGALQCVPKSPDCLVCPLADSCFAFINNHVGDLPKKEKKVKVRKRFFKYIHIRCGQFIVIRERQEGDIWQGLHDFPKIEKKTLDELCDWEGGINGLEDFVTLNVEESSHIFKHILTHQRIFANFVKFVIDEKEKDRLSQWAKEHGYLLVSDEQFENLGKPRLISKYLNQEK